MHSLMQFGGIGPVGSSRIGLASLARSETQYLEGILRGISERKQRGYMFPHLFPPRFQLFPVRFRIVSACGNRAETCPQFRSIYLQ